MRQVSGNYVKKGKAVPFDVAIPSSWEELDKMQMASMLEVMYFARADKYVITASLLSLLFDKHWHILANLPDEELHALTPLTNFLINTQPPAKNLVPKLRINGKEVIPSADDLSNIGFGEWCFAYQAASHFRQTFDDQFLNELIAVLYRPADPLNQPDTVGYTGDRRELFNENLVRSRASRVKDIEKRIRLLVFAWFDAALFQIMRARPKVFPPKPDSEEGTEYPLDDDTGRTWFSVFRDLLGPKWGTEQNLKHTNALFILDALEEDQIELKKMKK